MSTKPTENYLQFALKGVWPLKKRPTFNPIIWLYYLGWTVHSYLWLVKWWMKDKRGWRNGLLKIHLYPGHLSHRSDWTDIDVGALYTGRLEGWSAKAFEQFLQNIEEPPND